MAIVDTLTGPRLLPGAQVLPEQFDMLTKKQTWSVLVQKNTGNLAVTFTDNKGERQTYLHPKLRLPVNLQASTLRRDVRTSVLVAMTDSERLDQSEPHLADGLAHITTSFVELTETHLRRKLKITSPPENRQTTDTANPSDSPEHIDMIISSYSEQKSIDARTSVQKHKKRRELRAEILELKKRKSNLTQEKLHEEHERRREQEMLHGLQMLRQTYDEVRGFRLEKTDTSDTGPGTGTQHITESPNSISAIYTLFTQLYATTHDIYLIDDTVYKVPKGMSLKEHLLHIKSTSHVPEEWFHR